MRLHLVELAVEEFRHETADEVLDFLVGEGGVAPFLVGGHDPGVDLADGGMLLGDLPFRRQVELLVDPVGHAARPALSLMMIGTERLRILVVSKML